MKTHYHVVLFALLLPFNAFSDFVCSSDVSYKWQKSEVKDQKKDEKKEEKKEEKEDTTIHWSTLEQGGSDEAAAKDALSKYVVREQKKASETCKILHENLSGCITAKFASSKAELQAMDFGARKTLQEAIDAL